MSILKDNTEFLKSLEELSPSKLEVKENSSSLEAPSKKEETKLTIFPKYEKYIETLKLVAETSNIEYKDLVEDLDDEIFIAYSTNKKLVKTENAILSQIGSEVLSDLLWEDKNITVEGLKTEERQLIENVWEILGKSNVELKSEIKTGLLETEITYKLKENSTETLLKLEDLKNLSQFNELKLISFKPDTIKIRI